MSARSIIACLVLALAALTLGARPGAAQYAAQLYPYCAQSSSSGATSCYFRSRQECGSSCVDNPWYIGPRRAAPYLEGRRPLQPHYVPVRPW